MRRRRGAVENKYEVGEEGGRGERGREGGGE